MKSQRLVLVLAVAACSERTGQVRNNLDSGAAPLTRSAVAAEPVLVRTVSSSPDHLSDTLLWADSATRGDTTFLSRGRAITTNQVVTDSLWIQILPPPLPVGVPFGLFGEGNQPNTDFFTLIYTGENPATLPPRLAAARSLGGKMVISMTGGARANYLTNGVFDMSKWKARMDRFNTPELRTLMAQAVADGILIGNSVMDEPFNDGGPGNEGNSWGPRGTMTKARVDSMCGYAKTLFPTLPEGVFQDYRLASETSYRVCDFITSQYRAAKGSPTEYRDGALALCRRDQQACAFAINVLDGGIPAKRAPGQTNYAAGDCPLSTTGGRGTYFPNCRMTASQVREAGLILGPAGCFLTGFRYDSSFVASPANQTAFREVSAALAGSRAATCLRT